MTKTHKLLEKLWDNTLKEIFKNNGWKHTSGFNYTTLNDHLYDFTIIKHTNKPNTISACLKVKFIPLDDILWTILKMANNSKARFSLRVNGAFSISSKPIDNWKQEISIDNPEKDLVEIFNKVNNLVEEYSKKVIDVNSFLDFVLKSGEPKNVIDKNLYLTGLIYQGEIANAITFLKENIKNETGGFSVDRESFYELALKYCENN